MLANFIEEDVFVHFGRQEEAGLSHDANYGTKSRVRSFLIGWFVIMTAVLTGTA